MPRDPDYHKKYYIANKAALIAASLKWRKEKPELWHNSQAQYRKTAAYQVVKRRVDLVQRVKRKQARIEKLHADIFAMQQEIEQIDLNRKKDD